MGKNSILFVFTLFWLLLYCSAPEGKIDIYLAGDSTMAPKEEKDRPETGWGEMLGQFFDDGVIIHNHARNGRSTKSFIDQGRWKKIISETDSNDYVFIQFGHNDQKTDKTDRYAPPPVFKSNLVKFVKDVRTKGAEPVLVTPVVRRRFDEEGKFYDTHGVYPGIIRSVADSMKVLLIDLHKSSYSLLDSLGSENSKKLYLHLAPGESPNYPEGIKDDTHFNRYGARIIAGLVAWEIKNSGNKLKDNLSEFKEGKDGTE